MDMATMGQTSGPVAEFVACVVGLSRAQGESFTDQQGIGKSCLCCRFLHPDFEDYTEQHDSLLALHEFTSPVINNVHFLYWGTTDRNLRTKTTDRSVPVRFHIIEQTVFYQDETSLPFSSGTKPDSVNQYAKRITGSIECPGKVSYTSRNDIEIQSGQKQQYPARLRRLPRGFMVVIDISLEGENFARQLSRVEQILEHLMKQKQRYMIVATKRDECNVESLEQAQKLKRKYRTLLIETSASKNINIGDAFRLAALKSLHKKSQGISDSVPEYEDPTLTSMADRPRADQSKRYSLPLLSTLRITDTGRNEHHYSLVGTDEETTESTEREIAVEEGDGQNIVSPHQNRDERGSGQDTGQDILGEEKEKPTCLVQNLPDLIDSKSLLQIEQHTVVCGTDGDGKAGTLPTHSKGTKLSATAAADGRDGGDGGGGGRGEGTMTSSGKSSHFWKDWHSLKVVKPRRVFGGRGLNKNRSSAIEHTPLL